MNVGGGVVRFQLDTLVIHLVCLPKLLLVSQGLKIKGALRKTLHVVVGQNQTSCCCSVQRLQQRQTFVSAPERKERSPLRTWGTS